MMKIMNNSVSRFAHHAMGTTYELLIAGGDDTYSRQASQAVFSEIDRFENLFSRFNPCSEIGQINNLKPGQPLMVGVETYECLKTAALKYRKDNAPELKRLYTDIMDLFDLSQTSRGYTVKIRPCESSARPRHVNLDFGGIGKGYALDKTLEILSDWGIDNALIHGGTSSAMAIGVPSNSHSNRRGWPVGIGAPWDCFRSPKEFLLKNRALSGSGTEVKGKHIIDPRTGEPANGHLAAWVSHPSAAVSDALSTAFMVMDTDEIKAFCDNHPEVWALVIKDPHTCEIFNKEVAIQ
jgi:thiamine biosynthesis lipoprotein